MYAITASDPSPAPNCLPGSRTSNSIPQGGRKAGPVSRLLHQPALHRIVMHGVEFLRHFLVAPDVHIIKSPLPHPMVSVVMHRGRERERPQHPLAPRRLRLLAEAFQNEHCVRSSSFCMICEGLASSECDLTRLPAQPTFLTGGIFQVPSRIESGLSFGLYIRMIRMNRSAGAGSQLDSFSFPGDLCWMYRSTEPSGLVLN